MAPDHVPEGRSLRPLLENIDARWERPAITSYGENRWSARSERFRYIQYEDGLEELYDHQLDPLEFQNRANDPAYADVLKRLRQWKPESFAPSLGGRNG